MYVSSVAGLGFLRSCPFHPSLVGRRKEEGHRSFLFCKGTTETMKSDVIAVRQVLTQKEYANDLHIEGLIVYVCMCMCMCLWLVPFFLSRSTL